MRQRSALRRARGLGAAGFGTEHWWAERLTAIALIPLIVWFVIAVIPLTGVDHATALAWIGHPVNATLLTLLVAAIMHHGQLGLQVVIEDYVHAEGLKLASVLLVKAAALVLGLGSIFAVMKIAFGGA